jgi:hypothetical protein
MTRTTVLTFDDEDRAREEGARLNSRSGNPNVRYSVKIETEASDTEVVLATFRRSGPQRKKPRASAGPRSE